jgi:Zn-dependent protease with chaperone function
VRWRLCLVIAGVWLCAACSPSAKLPALSRDEIAAEKRKQEIAQLRDYYAQLHKLDTVAFRIATANREFCKDWVSAQIGLYAATPKSLPRKFHSFSAEALGLRWVRATVISVSDGSPADIAGFKNADELISFNGEPVPTTGTLGWMGGFLKFNGERPVKVVLLRNNEFTTLEVKPVLACAIPVNLDINPDPNAFTDYTKIVIQSGILRSTRTDADVATIVGHELAHVTMGHYQKKTINGLVGAVGGAAIDGGFMLGGVGTGGIFSAYLERAGMMAFSAEFEREADYVGAYYAARAGYDISGAEEIWRRFGLEVPDAIRLATTHPTSPVRYLQMRKAAEEIADKKRRNLPLLPEMKVMQVRSEPEPASETHF